MSSAGHSCGGPGGASTQTETCGGGMDLMKYLKPGVWQSVDSTQLTGLTLYTIVRTDRSTDPGTYRYAIKEVKDDGGKLALVTLEGGTGRKDPLDQVRNVELRLNENHITAINVEGDAVQLITPRK